MCVGTASHVGKSALVAALCRIYARRGYRVAPFKAQNMALNSFVTRDGAEIGRSQAYQARAAGVDPHVDMNPLLLKPSDQWGSQVVLLGRPVGHMTAEQYRHAQSELWPQVTAALRRLREAADLVVIEGAGSAAEINLREDDIVNMRVARHAQSPTLLIGDIDRGGVFASLVGHMELFSAEERALISGFVINRFRGEARLLEPGISFLEGRTGVPTLGVVPYLSDWHGEEEDAVGLEERVREAKPGEPVRVVVVRLPHISNFTDFDALAREPDVEVRFVNDARMVRGASAIVLPGTKSTVADLAWLRRGGFEAAIRAEVAAGAPLIGICGGYQMLGRRIVDLERIESDQPETAGLELLDVETQFGAVKRTALVAGEVVASGMLGAPGTPVRGYEIHMGSTRLGAAAEPALRLRDADGRVHFDGAVSAGAARPAAGLVLGTYLHGLFDEPAVREGFVNGLRGALGLPARMAEASPGIADIDAFADHVEAHLDLAKLAAITGLPL